MSDYTTGFEVAAAPADVFAAINNVRGWWSGDVEGVTDRLAGEFTYRHRDLHFSRQRIVELQPDARVVWQVLDCKLTFVESSRSGSTQASCSNCRPRETGPNCASPMSA